MKFFTTIFLSLFLIHQATSQDIVEVNYLGSATIQDIAISPLLLGFLKNGVDNYEVIYTTTDLEGNTVEVSGLMVIPDNTDARYPMLCYQHGTVDGPDAVPSNPTTGDASLTQLWGGLGYVAFSPDLLGLGVHEGIHPYVHAESASSVAVDMLRAVRTYCEQNDILVNDQVFLTGYSQGGHSSMAMHQDMEQNLSSEFTVTAASHQSGPYDISGVMRNLLFIEEDYGFVGYLPNTAISYQEVYGNLYDELVDIFKPEYAPLIEQYANDEIGLFSLNAQLSALLIQNEGVAAPGKLFQDSVIQNVQNIPTHPINVALAKNDTYNWAPTSPTQILYCTADDQVPFENSIVATDTMLALGTTSLTTVDVDPTATHVECVGSAIGSALFFFAQYQEIDYNVSTSFVDNVLPFEVYPNPVDTDLRLFNVEEEGQLLLTDMTGKTVLSENIGAGDHQLNVVDVASGMYLLQFVEGGRLYRQKIVVK